MKRVMLWFITFAALPVGALFAQRSITGTWQGTLKAARELRIVIKISTTDNDTLKAVLYSIDQGAQGMNASSITLQGSAVKMLVPGIGGAYEGKLSSDGSSIAGTWTQGPQPVTLNLMRATPETAWTIPEPPLAPKPMAADANPVFEVAAIKPSKPEARGKVIRVQGRRFSTMNTSLRDLVKFAYSVHTRQIVGAPAWFETEKYDLAAEPEGEGQPNETQLKIMIQKLLADRFQLVFHRDQKELSVYALTVAKNGPKLTKSEGDPSGLPTFSFRGLGMLSVRNGTMADSTGLLQETVLDRPVVDQTGLSGRWDFMLKWTPDEFQFPDVRAGGAPPSSPSGGPTPEAPDLFTAIQQQLGLKLESTKALAEVLVIDHVEKPSEN